MVGIGVESGVIFCDVETLDPAGNSGRISPGLFERELLSERMDTGYSIRNG